MAVSFKILDTPFRELISQIRIRCSLSFSLRKLLKYGGNDRLWKLNDVTSRLLIVDYGAMEIHQVVNFILDFSVYKREIFFFKMKIIFKLLIQNNYQKFLTIVEEFLILS